MDNHGVDLSGVAGRHIALIVAGIGTFLAAVQLLSVAGFDPDVAAAVVTAGDPGRVAIGVVVQLVPIFPVLVILLAWLHLLWPMQLTPTGQFIGAVVLAAGAVAGIFLLPLVSWALFGIGLALLYVRRWRTAVAPRRPRGDGARLPPKVRAMALGLSVVMIVAGAVLMLPVHYPTEVIEIQDGEPVVGYFVGVSGGWTTIAALDPRRIVIAPSESIAARTVCRLHGTRPEWASSLIRLLVPSTVPSCAEVRERLTNSL